MGDTFNVGDIVTRDGTDEHLVYDDGRDGGNIGVICIKAPRSYDGGEPWTSVGEAERNLARRYTLVRRATYAPADG